MKQNPLQRLGDFVLGKGFYIVLFLCVAAIGISGYYLVSSITGGTGGAAPVTANPALTLPDSSAREAEDSRPPEEDPGVPAAPSVQEDDPQPVKVPTQEESAPQPEPKDVVYTWPVKGQILRTFSGQALAYDATMGDWRTHNGLDIAAGEGIRVIAAGEGEVVQVYDDDLLGTTVVVSQPDGVRAVYANLAREVPVSVGEQVDTGSVLGTVGGTAIGESGLEPHLHLELLVDGVHVDPLDYLPEQS